MAKMLEINSSFARYKPFPRQYALQKNCCNLFLFILCISDCFRTLCVYKRRDFSPPTRDNFFGESNQQTRTGNSGG